MSNLLQPGQLFAGRYRIEKFLAKGGFGGVYVAEQLETELRVALKVLWPHVLFSDDAVEKFKLEARVSGRVDSEHIVKVFDAGLDDETKMPFLVMELLKGADLDSVVGRSGPLKREELVQYFRQIASALDKAHGYVDRNGMPRPIVHRDLKPQNLFLSHRETGDPVVKVLDFGIAKVLTDSMQVSQETKGTPLYMAFEQATSGRITPQTDIWALGLIGFFLLTGRCYWKAGHLPEASLTQLFAEVLSLPIDPPSVRATEIGAKIIPNAEFDAWFARCVDRNPARRFGTAGECVSALAAAFQLQETLRSGEAFRASAPSGSGRVQGSSSRSAVPGRTPPAANAVGSTGESLALGHTASPEPTKRVGTLAIVAAAMLAAGAGFGLFASRGGSTVPADALGSPGSESVPLRSSSPAGIPPDPSAEGPRGASGGAPSILPSAALTGSGEGAPPPSGVRPLPAFHHPGPARTLPAAHSPSAASPPPGEQRPPPLLPR